MILTLADALKSNRLAEFVAQEEARGVGPVDRKELDAVIKQLATTQLIESSSPRKRGS